MKLKRRNVLIPRKYQVNREMCTCEKYPVHFPNGSGHQSHCRIGKLYLSALSQSFAWKRLADHIRTVTMIHGTGN